MTQRALVLGALLVALACGAPPARVEAPSPPPAARPVVTEEPAPFERVTALPAAPYAVFDVEVAALRSTPLEPMIARLIEGSSPGDVMMQRLIARCERVRLGVYRETSSLALIAEGPLEGVVAATVAELEGTGAHVPELVRYGVTTYVLGDDMVAIETAPDRVVLTYPQHVDEILAAALGRAPAVPLPIELRALDERPTLTNTPLRMRTFVRREETPVVDALDVLLREAGAAGVSARVEGDRLRVTGSTRVPLPHRAAGHARDVEALLRTYTDADAESASLGESIRGTAVRVDGAWVDLELRVSPNDLEPLIGMLMRIAGI